MNFVNYSAESKNLLYSWLPYDLEAETVVFLPDACPGRSPLPTGTVVLTNQNNWRKFAVSDCGCGILLAKSSLKFADFNKNSWDRLYFDLKINKGKLGDLGSGNHFLDALQSYEDEFIYFLIHTGSREESKLVEPLVDFPSKFDEKFKIVCDWAKDNRLTIAKMLEKYFGKLEIILDKNHNGFEILNNGYVIIRKGAVKLLSNETAVIPSSMNGDVVLVKAKDTINKVLNSMSHGTGRIMSRSEAKTYAEKFDYKSLREMIYIPNMISDASIKTEAPFCYRAIDSCLQLIDKLVTEVQRFSPFAYLGQI
jgi:RNA-splicing ligase RtcB